MRTHDLVALLTECVERPTMVVFSFHLIILALGGRECTQRFDRALLPSRWRAGATVSGPCREALSTPPSVGRPGRGAGFPANCRSLSRRVTT